MLLCRVEYVGIHWESNVCCCIELNMLEFIESQMCVVCRVEHVGVH